MEGGLRTLSLLSADDVVFWIFYLFLFFCSSCGTLPACSGQYLSKNDHIIVVNHWQDLGWLRFSDAREEAMLVHVVQSNR